MVARIAELCNELLHSICLYLDPWEVAALMQTCKNLYSILKNDQLLFKHLYLQRWDDPRRRPKDTEPCWESELQRLARFERIMRSLDFRMKMSSESTENEEVLATACGLILAANPKHRESRNALFLSSQLQGLNEEAYLKGSRLMASVGRNPHFRLVRTPKHQLSAKLHCLRGNAIQIEGDNPTESLHCYARAEVYDLRNYTTKTMWGPFLDEPGPLQVDWEKLETIMVLLTHNLSTHIQGPLSRVTRYWTEDFKGATPGSYVSERLRDFIKEPALPLEAGDPYGVTGTWKRVVCFLDYTDFYIFNFSDRTKSRDVLREPNDTRETVRLILMMLQVTKIEPPRDGDGKELPVVHFKGTSRSVATSWDPNANSSIRGTVRLAPEGEVHWTSISVFHGEERWRSEGIQIGGVRSARGVFGTWFDKDYDDYGPCGPTAYWKLRDSIQDPMNVESDSESDSDSDSGDGPVDYGPNHT